MKVCIVSQSDGKAGGFAAAYRLHQGLRVSGADTTMLVGNKTRDDVTIFASQNKLAKGWEKLVPTLDALPLKLYPQRDRDSYSLEWLPDTISPHINRLAPDIINLHWINGGYVQIETIAKLKKPIVWTLHDMWAFTGGCHYSGKCDRYTQSCGYCPQLHSNINWDLSSWVWRRKAKAWQNLNLTIVTPSTWLAERAKDSSLFQGLRIEVIPNALDTQSYKKVDKHIARSILGLPLDKHIVLFGAVNATSTVRKGFHLLCPTLQLLSQSQWQDKIELVIFGASQPLDSPKFGFKTHYLGRLNDDLSLSLVYAAADVFVAPSIEDNLPNTVMEALACATPCVAFKIGGMSDLIEHQQNGYLAQPFMVEDFAQGISWIIAERDRYSKLSERSRQKVEQEFTLSVQSKRYLSLFQNLKSKVI